MPGFGPLGCQHVEPRPDQVRITRYTDHIEGLTFRAPEVAPVQKLRAQR